MRQVGIEYAINTVTTFEFTVFDQKGNKDFLFDATPEQCLHYLWKKHPSAHVTEMYEFGIGTEEKYVKRIDWTFLKNVKNPYLQGHDEDMNVRTKRIKDEKENIKNFKNKHKIE